jgi:hypothetical protein
MAKRSKKPAVVSPKSRTQARKKLPIPDDLFIWIESKEAVYVRLEYVMNPWVALTDGLAIAFIGEERTMCITVDQAIEWCCQQLSFSIKAEAVRKYGEMIAVLARVKRQTFERRIGLDIPS